MLSADGFNVLVVRRGRGYQDQKPIATAVGLLESLESAEFGDAARLLRCTWNDAYWLFLCNRDNICCTCLVDLDYKTIYFY